MKLKHNFRKTVREENLTKRNLLRFTSNFIRMERQTNFAGFIDYEFFINFFQIKLILSKACI